MPSFSYKAVRPQGDVVEGVIDAPDRAAAVETMRRQGLMPIRATEVARVAGRGRGTLRAARRTAGRPGQGDVLMLTRELATLLSAGLPVDRALATLGGVAGGPLAAMIARLLDRVRGGAALAEALEEFRDVVPAYYIGMVRAGEAGGRLDLVFSRLAETMARAQEMRAEIRSALTYPMIVLVVAGLSVVVLLTAVIPEFRPLFEDAGAALPASTRVILALSDGFARWWWAVPLVPLLLAALLARQAGTPAGRLRRDRLALRLPLAGRLVRALEAARFLRTLGTLLDNGVTLLAALPMARDTLGNRVMVEAVSAAQARLKLGEGFAGPLAASGAFPELAVQLVRVGEESGRLAPMLLRAADIHDQEARRTIQRLLALLVPGVTVGLGVVVAFIIASMLSAILAAYDLPL